MRLQTKSEVTYLLYLNVMSYIFYCVTKISIIYILWTSRSLHKLSACRIHWDGGIVSSFLPQLKKTTRFFIFIF